MQKHVNNNIIFVDKPKMSIVPLVLSAASLFFVVLGAASLFYLQPRLQETQIIQDQASIGGGTVILTSELASSTTFTQGVPSLIDLKFNAQGVQLSGIQLQFRVTTNAETPTIEVPENSGLMAIHQEVEKVSDGYLISMIISARNVDDAFTSTTPKTFARLSVPLLAAGQIQIGYDRPGSIAAVADAVENVDQLRTPVDVTFSILSASPVGSPTATPVSSPVASPIATPIPTPVPTPIPTPVPVPTPTPVASPILTTDDLYPVGDQVSVTFITDDGNRTVVQPGNLRAYQNYRAIVQYRVQNTNKAATTQGNVLQAFVINGQGYSYTTQNIAYQSIRGNANGATSTVEVRFTALPNNELRISTDANNGYVETNENNNALLYRFTSAVAATPDNGLQRSCNQYCADSRECSAGYTCFYNRCRRPDNPDSTTCGVPSANVATTISQGCNVGCTTNKQCANNLRCYNGACRLATNPSSFSCSAVTAQVITKPIGGVGYIPEPTQPSKGAEIPLPSTSPVGASVRPSTAPSVRPVGSARPGTSPIPFVENTDEPTTLNGTIFASIMKFFQSRGISLPIIAVGLGLILFVLALILALLGSGRRRPPTVIKRTEPPVTPAEDELQRKINALKAGPQAGPRVQAVTPVVAVRPVAQTIQQAPQTVMINKPAAVTPVQPQGQAQPSMMSRLKDRGVMDTVGKTPQG